METEKYVLIQQEGMCIHPYIKGQCKPIENMFSHYDEVYHKRIFDICYIDENTESFLIPRSSLTAIHEYLPDYEIIRNDVIKSRNMSCTNIKEGVSLRDNQVDIYHKMMTINHNNIFVNIPTAVGKTFMGILYALSVAKKTVIVTKSSKILSQWAETIANISTSGDSTTLRIGSSKMLLDIIGGKFKIDKYDFFIITSGLITSFMTSNSSYEFSQFIKIAGIGLKIIDEAHLALKSTVKLNACANIERSLYLSADATRGNKLAKKDFDIVFHNTTFISMEKEELRKLKHIVATFVTYDSNPNGADLQYVQGGKYHWNHQKFEEYSFLKNTIQSKIMVLMNDILRSSNGVLKHKVLILLTLIGHVTEIQKMLSEIYADKLVVRAYHSEMTEEEQSEALKADVIVSTYQSFSAGVNIVDPEIRFMISTLPVDPVTSNQAAGRCRPLADGSVSFAYFLYDIGFSYCDMKMTTVASYLRESKVKELFKVDYGSIADHNKGVETVGSI